MNFFEIINKCLLELNYRQVEAFSSLVKNDHKRIISIMNILNKEICSTEFWNFLLRKDTIILPQGENEVENTIPGRILYMINENSKYEFCDNIEPFVTEKSVSGKYSIMNNKLLFPKFSQDKSFDVFYYTRNCAVSSDGVEKVNLENEDDCSLIPMPFCEQLLVYGTCMRMKANPQHVKFSYWMSMYKDALQNLKSKTSVYAKYAPTVRLHRF